MTTLFCFKREDKCVQVDISVLRCLTILRNRHRPVGQVLVCCCVSCGHQNLMFDAARGFFPAGRLGDVFMETALFGTWDISTHMGWNWKFRHNPGISTVFAKTLQQISTHIRICCHSELHRNSRYVPPRGSQEILWIISFPLVDLRRQEVPNIPHWYCWLMSNY